MNSRISEITKEPVMVRIMEELQKQGKTGKELERAVGLGNGAFSRWKHQKGTTYMNYIDKIAEFLGVTPEYLQSIPEKKVELENLTEAEKNLVLSYRKMKPDERRCMLEVVDIFLNSSELRKMKEKDELYSKKYNNNETETTETGGGPSEENENPLS